MIRTCSYNWILFNHILHKAMLKFLGTSFSIQGSCVQNHWMAPRSTQSFILLRSIKRVAEIYGNLLVKSKLPFWSDSLALRQLNVIYKKGSLSFFLHTHKIFCYKKNNKQGSVMTVSNISLHNLRDISRNYFNARQQFQTEPTSAAEEALSLKISSHGASQMITKTIPISSRIVKSYAMKCGISFWLWWKVNGNWKKNMISISQWMESYCKTNTRVGRKKEIQMNRTVKVTVRNPTRKVKVTWDLSRVHQVYWFYQNRLASPFDGY